MGTIRTIHELVFKVEEGASTGLLVVRGVRQTSSPSNTWVACGREDGASVALEDLTTIQFAPDSREDIPGALFGERARCGARTYSLLLFLAARRVAGETGQIGGSIAAIESAARPLPGWSEIQAPGTLTTAIRQQLKNNGTNLVTLTGTSDWRFTEHVRVTIVPALVGEQLEEAVRARLRAWTGTSVAKSGTSSTRSHTPLPNVPSKESMVAQCVLVRHLLQLF